MSVGLPPSPAGTLNRVPPAFEGVICAEDSSGSRDQCRLRASGRWLLELPNSRGRTGAQQVEDHWSLWKDMRLLCRPPLALIRSPGE